VVHWLGLTSNFGLQSTVFGLRPEILESPQLRLGLAWLRLEPQLIFFTRTVEYVGPQKHLKLLLGVFTEVFIQFRATYM
jgi:hypothetical protein